LPNTYRLKYFITKGSTGINENRPVVDHVIVVRGSAGPMKPAGTERARAATWRVSMRVRRNSVAVFFLAGAVAMLASGESGMSGGDPMSERSAKPEVSLDFEYFPRGDETALRLLASRPEIGLAFKFHCFEAGPFHEGTAQKRPDGSVVFAYESGEMKCVTTFTPKVGGRVEMDLEVTGPLDELKKIRFIDGCLQHWESPAFRRRGALVEFAERAFIYTMRGPVSLLDTPRGAQKGFAADSSWNTPPCTQWYVEHGSQHPGDVWAFGTCGDRPVVGLIGAVSRDGKWLTAVGRPYNLSIGQGWHDCLHCGGHTRWYLDEAAGRIHQKTMLYVMPNDKEALLRAYFADFPGGGGATAEPSDDQGLRGPRPGSRLGVPLSVQESGDVLWVRPEAPGAPALQVSIAVPGNAAGGGRWKQAYWGTSVREGGTWRMWAHPVGDALELCVSTSAVTRGEPVVQASLEGDEWVGAPALEGVPARVLRSRDGAWTAALFWERSSPDDPLTGVGELQEPRAGSVSVRGRLVVYRGEPDQLAEQWEWAHPDWENAVPYRMPAPGAALRSAEPWVTFAPNRERLGEERLTYGLTILPPWKDAGYLHVNFPEHLEYDDEDPTNDYIGYSILRHWDELEAPWEISADGRTASYRVESPHEPGVVVEVRLTAQASQAVLWMKVTNGSGKRLPRVKPMLCFQYKKLTGFPQNLDGNFQYTYVVMDGELTRLADVETARPDPQAMVAYVKGCDQHDSDKFANARGGLIAREIDAAVAAVTSKDGRRKVVLGFAPPKSMLSNTFIPCFHADPYFGDLEPGESAEASGVVVFTEDDLGPVVKEVVGLEWVRGAGR